MRCRRALQDSNQFHAVALDTYPPIFYMNDVSRFIVQMCTRYNAHAGEIKAAYTYDAGPNACIYCRKQDVATILALVDSFLPPNTAPADGKGFYRGLTTGPPPAGIISDELRAAIGLAPIPDGINYVLHTEPGPGPRVIEDPAESLLGPGGLPKRTV